MVAWFDIYKLPFWLKVIPRWTLYKNIYLKIQLIRELYICDAVIQSSKGVIMILPNSGFIGWSRVHLDTTSRQILSDVTGKPSILQQMILIGLYNTLQNYYFFQIFKDLRIEHDQNFIIWHCRKVWKTNQSSSLVIT
jgi:hypothetical protein